jgi:hypothetical protein
MLNLRSFSVFWVGALFLQNGYLHCCARDGFQFYTFFLFFFAGIVWGYFWGERILKIPEDETDF